ncbi:MAG TPA: DUF6232 family protein, partial [Actinoplanes sp.]|nr:DUF6232 family protein [Actinoplanes sp.]
IVITYYRDKAVTVTSTGVQLDGEAYSLGEFVRVWHRRGRRSWSSLVGRSALGIAMLLPVLAGGIGVVVALSIDATPLTTITLVGGGILVGLAALPLADYLLERLDRSYARGSRNLQIWAEVRGAQVLLLQTDDALRFGKIYRALQRALERGERPPAH